MSDSTAPRTLTAAQQMFSKFLSGQKYPETICWLMPGDVIVNAGRYWVRKREAEATSHAALRYEQGIRRNLGILLEAICASESETFAWVFIPEDDQDAQHHLMGHGLKLSCPVEKHHASAISNRFKWLLLYFR